MAILGSSYTEERTPSPPPQQSDRRMMEYRSGACYPCMQFFGDSSSPHCVRCNALEQETSSSSSSSSGSSHVSLPDQDEEEQEMRIEETEFDEDWLLDLILELDPTRDGYLSIRTRIYQLFTAYQQMREDCLELEEEARLMLEDYERSRES